MISIVVPAYNEQEHISDCLSSLSRQDYKGDIEVILVDNRCTDDTVKVARGFNKWLNLKIVKQPVKGRGPARAKGFSAAKGDIILSADADTRYPKTWVSTLVSALKYDTIASTGTCKVDDLSPLRNMIFNMGQPLAMRIYRLMFGHYWLSGFSFAIREEAYKKTGGFNKKINAMEDIELGFRAKNIGKITFVTGCPVIFSGRRFKTGLISGTLSYIKIFYKAFLLKKKDIHLSDVRSN